MANMETVHMDAMKKHSKEQFESFLEYRKVVSKIEGEKIPEKTRELIKFGIACTLRSAPAMLSHAESSLKAGVSKEELLTVLTFLQSMGGMAVYREAIVVLADFFDM